MFSALVVVFISLTSGQIDFKVRPSALNRYEFFVSFLYFSVVSIIYSANNSKSAEEENVSLDSLTFMNFSFKPMVVIVTLSIFVLASVFLTA